jgi:exopolysaccharide biosynthesis predicted pyruvyltransferase EpsI
VKDDALLDALRRRVCEEVRRVTKPGPVALLDFPNYANPGDSAIWLGALACLSSLGFAPPVYTSEHRTFDEGMLRRALPTGTILLTGGGTLGDLWPGAQVFRERILRAFPDHAIVQLPQTVHFTEPAALASARVAFRSHSNFTVLVRDARSLEVATDALQCRASLCPDLAFCLTPATEQALRVERTSRDDADTLHLFRSDHEATGQAVRTVGDGVRRLDWVTEAPSPLQRLARGLGDYLATKPQSTEEPSFGERVLRRTLSASYPALARRRLRRGCRLLASAGVVVTDRLHGHVLALLLGVPHVVLGDRNGKLRGFIDSWTSPASLLRWADSPDEVPELARDLVSHGASIRT